MEFEQMVNALEFKLQPKVFVDYSSTLRARLGSFGLVRAHLGLFWLIPTFVPQSYFCHLLGLAFPIFIRFLDKILVFIGLF